MAKDYEVTCPACGGERLNPKTKKTCRTCKGKGKIKAKI